LGCEKLILVQRFQVCNSRIVSALESCRGLPAIVPDLANRPRQLVFFTPIDSQLNDFLKEIHQIAHFEPSIVERIDEDLDLHAKKKKLLRLADAEFLAGQTLDLPKLQLQLRELKVDDIELETGRPRTDAYVVYLFLMLRGFNGGCKDQHARLLLEESITLKLWLEHLGLQLPPASTLSDNLNAVSNRTRVLIHEVQLRLILQQGLDDFQKCFIDSTAVEANTERPTDSTVLVRLIARVCTTGGNLHRLALPDMNQIGLSEQQEELRRLSQQIHFLNGKARGEAKRKKVYFQLLRRVRRLRKRLLRDLESVRRNLEGRADLPPSRRLMGEEALCLIAEDLAALGQAADVCERRIMKQEKVPVAEKIISLSDSDASFIVKGGWNSVVGYRPQLARSGSGFVTGLVLPRGNAADSPHLAPMVNEQITNTGVIPSLASADDGYSSQEGLEEVLRLGVKVVSISGAKGKKLIEERQWKSRTYRQARAERSAIESLVFSLKEGFEFGEMARRTHENVLAEMLEKVLAYNISQIIRVRKKLSELQEMERPAA
jgi:transposase, IS5 family